MRDVAGNFCISGVADAGGTGGETLKPGSGNADVRDIKKPCLSGRNNKKTRLCAMWVVLDSNQ